MKVDIGPITSNPAGSPKIKPTAPATSNTEAENFEKLAGKLVQVPKTEIDEQRQKS
jgi:hypothetical protein